MWTPHALCFAVSLAYLGCDAGDRGSESSEPSVRVEVTATTSSDSEVLCADFRVFRLRDGHTLSSTGNAESAATTLEGERASGAVCGNPMRVGQSALAFRGTCQPGEPSAVEVTIAGLYVGGGYIDQNEELLYGLNIPCKDGCVLPFACVGDPEAAVELALDLRAGTHTP